jgi:hypothetical protein
VSVTSSLGGSFQPASSLTSGFPISLANFLYSAPANASGLAVITARAGNVQTTANVNIVCGAAPVPTSTSAPLAPPSAGDGGLVGSSSAGYLPAALAIAAAVVVLGITAGSRRFAAVTADAADAGIPVAAPGTANGPGGFALLVSFVMLLVALLARRWR